MMLQILLKSKFLKALFVDRPVGMHHKPLLDFRSLVDLLNPNYLPQMSPR